MKKIAKHGCLLGLAVLLAAVMVCAGCKNATGIGNAGQEITGPSETPAINIDTDGDGRPDVNIDTDGDGIPDVNIDTNGDGTPDINIDTNGDGIPDVNIDTNDDGIPDINIDKNGDGTPDINIDTNDDGIPDQNVDTDGDGKADPGKPNIQDTYANGDTGPKGGIVMNGWEIAPVPKNNNGGRTSSVYGSENWTIPGSGVQVPTTWTVPSQAQVNSIIKPAVIAGFISVPNNQYYWTRDGVTGAASPAWKVESSTVSFNTFHYMTTGIGTWYIRQLP